MPNTCVTTESTSAKSFVSTSEVNQAPQGQSGSLKTHPDPVTALLKTLSGIPSHLIKSNFFKNVFGCVHPIGS